MPVQNSLHRSVVKLIIDNCQAGAALHELADRYNVRRTTVRNALRRAGFNTNANARRATLTETHQEEIRDRFTSGTTKRKLAMMFDVSETTVRRALRMTV